MFRLGIYVTALAAMTSLGLTAQGGVVELVSVATHGGPSAVGANDLFPDISDDGRFVLFHSLASDLVSNDTNGIPDVFLRDLWQQKTICVSVDTNGVPVGGQEGTISGDGRFVFFNSRAGGFVPGVGASKEGQLYAWDRLTNAYEVISQSTSGAPGNAGGGRAAASQDGMVVVFESGSTNLIKNDVNGNADVFVRDRRKGTTIRASQTATGIGGNDNSLIPAISPDGTWVAFHSKSHNLVWPDSFGTPDVFLYEISSQQLSLISRDLAGQPASGWLPALSTNALEVWFESGSSNLVPNDTNSGADIFVYRRLAGSIERVSELPGGKEFQTAQCPSSNNGHACFWQLSHPALPNGYKPQLILLRAGSRELAIVDSIPWDPTGKSCGLTHTAISADGRTVVFRAGNLTPQDILNTADIYVRYFYPSCTAHNDAVVGNATRFDFEDPGAANQIYVAVTGMDFTPGVHLGGARYLHVAPDELFMASLTTPSLFFRYAGVLDANGKASALFLIPPIPALRGLPTVTACVVFDASRYNGVRGVSNSVPLTVK